jgi:hypothetical protein
MASKALERRGTPKGKGTVVRPNGSRIGNPPHLVTEEMEKKVFALVAAGTPQVLIADVLEVSVDTLHDHYGRVMRLAKAEANSKVVESLYNKAVGGDVGAAIWWTKTQLGWRETQKVEMTGADGGPIVTEQRSQADVVKARLAAIRERMDAVNDPAA